MGIDARPATHHPSPPVPARNPRPRLVREIDNHDILPPDRVSLSSHERLARLLQAAGASIDPVKYSPGQQAALLADTLDALVFLEDYFSESDLIGHILWIPYTVSVAMDRLFTQSDILDALSRRPVSYSHAEMIHFYNYPPDFTHAIIDRLAVSYSNKEAMRVLKHLCRTDPRRVSSPFADVWRLLGPFGAEPSKIGALREELHARVPAPHPTARDLANLSTLISAVQSRDLAPADIVALVTHVGLRAAPLRIEASLDTIASWAASDAFFEFVTTLRAVATPTTPLTRESLTTTSSARAAIRLLPPIMQMQLLPAYTFRMAHPDEFDTYLQRAGLSPAETTDFELLVTAQPVLTVDEALNVLHC